MLVSRFHIEKGRSSSANHALAAARSKARHNIIQLCRPEYFILRRYHVDQRGALIRRHDVDLILGKGITLFRGQGMNVVRANARDRGGAQGADARR